MELIIIPIVVPFLVWLTILAHAQTAADRDRDRDRQTAEENAVIIVTW